MLLSLACVLTLLGGCSTAGTVAIEAPTTSNAAPVTTTTGPATTDPPEAATTMVSGTTSTTASPVPPSTTAPLPLDTGSDATRARFDGDLGVLTSTGPRTAGSPEELGTASWLKSEITSITGADATVEDVPLPTGLTSINVWAPPIGTGRTVLLGAHIDSVPGSPGLDDNGSGMVVLLEVMRRLTEDPVDGVAVQIVFFGAEEVIDGGGSDDHHFGSRQAAARMDLDGALPEWMLSVDMIGVGGDLVAVAYEGTDAAAAQLLAAAGSNVGTSVITLDRGDISDHEAFARAGSLAAMLWRPDNPAWHTPADDTVDTSLLLADLAVIEAFLALVAAGT